MRIAVTADDDRGLESPVGHHLGRSPYIVIVDIEDDLFGHAEVFANPQCQGHQHGAIPTFVRDLGAEVMLSGGMGRHANALFEQYDIQRASGAAGTVRQAISDFLAGKLSGVEPCPGEGAHEGHSHDHRIRPGQPG